MSKVYFKAGKLRRYPNQITGADFEVTSSSQLALYEEYKDKQNELEFDLQNGVFSVKSKSLSELKQEKLSELNTNYNNALTFTHTFSDNQVLTLTLTEQVQIELNKRGVSLSVNTDASKTFVFYDNNYQKITRNVSDSNEYLEAVADYLEDLREKKTDKTIAINVAQDETALNNVDITFS